MKVSNNALNFLLAQYRAIFKRAYVKGLASAVLLTAGLAVGQAQAATTLNDTTAASSKLATDNAEITIDGSGSATDTYDKIQISGGSTIPAWNADVKITSGAPSDNWIKASGGNVNLSGNGSLTISTSDADHGLAISGGTSSSDPYTTTVDIGSISITKGTLAIADGQSGSVTVAAGTITIGAANSAAAATDNAILTLSATNNTYSATLGDSGSDIIVNGDGKLEVTAGSGTATIKGASLTLNDGAFMLVKNHTSTSGTLNIETDNFTLGADSVHVISGSDASKTATTKFAGQVGIVNGNLLVDANGILDISAQTSVAAGETAPAGLGTVKLASGSNTVVSGSINVNNGTLIVDDKATLAAAKDGAAINVNSNSSADTAGALQISSAKLDAYLKGGADNQYKAITAADGTVAPSGSNGASGAITISGGTLYLTDEEVDLAKTFTFSGASSAQNGMITVITTGSTNSTIAGKHLILSNKLTKDGSNDAGVGSVLSLEAETLTLGEDGEDMSTTDFGFSGATTQNFEAKGNNFVLKNQVTLSAVDVTTNGNETVVEGEEGTIKGSFKIAGGKDFTLEHGSYTNDGNITISGGTLAIKNGEVEDTGKYVDTIWKVSGKLDLQAAASSKLEINGGDADDHGVQTVLDITGLGDNFTVTGAASQVVDVQILSGGTLLATGAQLTELLQVPETSGHSGSKVLLDGGFIKIEGDAELTGTQLTSGSTASNPHAIYFNNDGTLEVENTLKITGVTNLNIGTDGQIKAGILNLNGADANTAATLSSGNYTAINSLTSDAPTKGVTIGAYAKVNLGDIEGKGTEESPWAAASTGSTLATNITLNNESGALTVKNGDWTGGRDITVTKGTLTVGALNGDSAYLDADGEAITASLALGNLDIGTDTTAQVIVNETGTLTTNGFKAANTNALTVDGTVTIKGVADTAQTPTPNYNYGIDIGSGSVDVNAGGQLRLTGYAITALGKTTADASGNFFTTASNSYDADGITVNAGGEVYFDFAEGTTLSAEALTDLRAALFDTQADGTVAGSINIGAATISGIEPDPADGKYDWNKLQGIGDVLTNFTTDELKAGVVKNIETGDSVRGHFGALESSTITQGGKINIVGNSSLNAAANGQFATGLNGAQLGLNVAQGVRMDLNNGGAIGEISLAQDSTLGVNKAAGITNPGKTTIAAIDGASGVAEFGVGEVEVTGETRVANLVTSAQGVATFGGDVTVGSTGSKLETDLLGSNTFNGAATFNTNTEIGDGSTANFNKGVEFAEGAGIYGNTSVTGGAEFGDYTEIGGAATLTADAIELNQASTGSEFRFVVGEEDYVENGQTMPGSTGYLQAKSVTLNGNTLVIDPSYDHATSVAAIEGFADAVNNDEDAGTFNGTIFVGQNAALGVGQGITIADVQSFIKQYQNSRGALIQDQVGSVMYLDGMLTAANNSRIILDSQHTQDQVFVGSTSTPALIGDNKTYVGDYTDKAGVTANNKNDVPADLYLGQNTILAVSDAILADGAAVHFNKSDAAIMAQKVTDAEDAAKIVLDGNGFLDSRDVTLFTDTGANTGVKVLGDQDIRVETLNGVMYFMLNAGEEVATKTLQLDTTKIDTAFLGATDESRNLLFAYSSQTANWEEHFDPANLAKDPQNDDTYVEREVLHGDVASSNIVSYDSTNGGDSIVLSQPAIDAGYTTDDFVVVQVKNEDGTQATDKDGKYLATVYNRAYNDLLEAIARNTNGAATDSAALQGVFGGAAQAALLAARTSQEAVAGRTGVGASSSALTFADNGQGAGLWVNPIYVSQDSDGFEVGNKDYGVDIDLYGVALGGDYTLANGVRVGAFFNVGSGEADGNGQANGVSNDFDYYGVGLYAGYSVGQFSIVGDVSYSVVDSEIDASTAVGKITSSFDTDNLSVGVTGQYEFDFNGTLVTPHVGLRYSALSVDDYSFKAADYTQGGDASIDDANVFSIPVGVTVAKEFTFNTWTVKPSLDVTVQGNFGDDELDSTAEWDNVAWQSNYSSEFIDNFTYGATLGVAAKTGSFSAGIGLGYQGSSNTDEFSATANARFTF